MTHVWSHRLEHVRWRTSRDSLAFMVVEDISKLRRVQGDKPLKYVVWEITLKCDLACRHCGSRAGHARPNELSTHEALDLVKALADQGVQEITLIGGEAYLRDDWDVIAKSIVDHGMACSMTTGGRGFDDERLARAVEAGMSAISVSIDGLEKTHNALRGPKDAFRKGMEAAERIGKSPIRCGFNTQINRLSMPELAALAQLLIDVGGKAWQVQLTVPMGNAADRPDLLLQPYDLLELFPLLVWIKEHKLKPAGVSLFAGNNIGYFSEYEERLRYGGNRGAHWKGCSAGNHCMGIEADGALKGCPSLPTEDFTGGYFREMSVAEALETHEVAHLKSRTRDDLWGFCNTCYYADVCKAGCTWTSQVIMGRPGNNPYCIHRARTFEDRGQREVLRRVEAAPGVPFDHGRFEVHVEDFPETSGPPTILGRPVEEVIGMLPSDGAVFGEDERKKRLQVLR